MKITIGILVVAMVMPVISRATPPAQPPLPYKSEGACPFECCTYRTWTVEADTDVLAEHRDGSRVAFRVRRGQRVDGLTGVVITATLGRAIVRRAGTLGAEGHSLTVRPGDDVFVLHYVGEGYWKLWVQGSIIDDQLPDKDGGCENDLREPIECAIQITERPDAVWWAKIRSHGRTGWTRELDHFGNVDACG